jgi:ammonium transporter, Amt family
MAYSFTVSYIILFIMDKIPGLRLRVDERSEMEGLDYSQIGEYAFEALTEKEAQFNLADIVGDAEANDHGGIVAK